MSKYSFYCPCDLKHNIIIDERFIGKKIPIKILGYVGFVLFPITRGNGELDYKLINPNLDKHTGETICGSYPKTKYPNGRVLRHPKISRVYIRLNIDLDIKDKYELSSQIIEEIERVTNKFVKCISVTHPSSIRWSYSKEEGYVEPINYFSLINAELNKDEGSFRADVCFYDSKEEITIKEFFYIYRNIEKNISLQYALLADIKRCFARREYREVVLNCATIIEKTLKEQILEYLEKKCETVNIKELILKSIDGFNKIIEVMKKFELNVDNCGSIKDGTIFIRNRVIHGGYIPSELETKQAIRDAKQIMKQYNVQLFVD